MADTESIRMIVCQRIEKVECAMKSLQEVRSSLVKQAYEAKQNILNAYVTERNVMQSEEVNLLIEVDKLLHCKDDALVTQLSKLSQVLGCLRNCLQGPHPCGECLEKYDDIDMLSADEVSHDFAVANELLTKNIKRSVQPMIDSMETASSFSDASETDCVTKWLLTPSNNHTESPRPRQEPISTEWLLQHSLGTSPATETESIFSYVKAEEAGLWLRKETTPDGFISSRVYQSVHTHSSRNMEEWLEKNCRSRQPSVSDDGTVASDVTSSLHSSCIILSGSTSEDSCMSILSGDRSVVREPVFHHESPHAVSQWVATCKNEDMQELNPRHRRKSVESFVSCGPDEPMEGLTERYNMDPERCSADLISWRTIGNSDSRALGDDWLNVNKSGETGAAFRSTQPGSEMAEWSWKKSDAAASALVSDDGWLSCSQQTFEAEGDSRLQLGWMSDSAVAAKLPRDTFAWLTGEEKSDAPENKNGTSKLDRDWLLVKNELHKIAISNNSEWLIGDASEDISVKDNRFFTT